MKIFLRTAIAMAAMLAASSAASVASVFRGSPRPGKSTANQLAFRPSRSGKQHRTDANGCGQREHLRYARRAQGGPGIVRVGAVWISR